MPFTLNEADAIAPAPLVFGSRTSADRERGARSADHLPTGGDESAWATLPESDTDEWVELGFEPTVASAIWIFENVGADGVKRVVAHTASGDVVTYLEPEVRDVTDCYYILAIPTQTNEPITGLRIELASERVYYWQEIDAVGLVP